MELNACLASIRQKYFIIGFLLCALHSHKSSSAESSVSDTSLQACAGGDPLNAIHPEGLFDSPLRGRHLITIREGNGAVHARGGCEGPKTMMLVSNRARHQANLNARYVARCVHLQSPGPQSDDLIYSLPITDPSCSSDPSLPKSNL